MKKTLFLMMVVGFSLSANAKVDPKKGETNKEKKSETIKNESVTDYDCYVSCYAELSLYGEHVRTFNDSAIEADCVTAQTTCFSRARAQAIAYMIAYDSTQR